MPYYISKKKIRLDFATKAKKLKNSHIEDQEEKQNEFSIKKT